MNAVPCVKWRELTAVIATATMTAMHPVRQNLHTVL